MKKITITIIESDLKLPKHLQKPATLDMQVEGFQELEAIQMLLSCAVSAFNGYKDKIDQAVKQLEDRTKLKKL